MRTRSMRAKDVQAIETQEEPTQAVRDFEKREDRGDNMIIVYIKTPER